MEIQMAGRAGEKSSLSGISISILPFRRKGDEMTPEEEKRGRRLQLARVKKNEMQCERYRRTAEEERKLKNVIRERFAEEERKLKNVCLTVTDICRI
jgi:hypothetical protein